MLRNALASLLLGSIAFASGENDPSVKTPEAPASSIPAAPNGLAIKAKKVLALPLEGQQVWDHAIVLVKDGKIEKVGSAKSTAIPAGYDVLDLGDKWLAPGMIDLHNHVAGALGDLNDMVYLTNPGVRASCTVDPQNGYMLRGVASGVTSVLLIPGSGTNMGGQGVLLKSYLPTYEQMEIRNPGSLKLAQAGNPERWVIGPRRSFMNWNTRNTFKRGVAYAKRWEQHRENGAPKPKVDLQLEVFRHLYEKETQVSTHTQIFQVVLMTINMVKRELGLDVYIDHGTFDGWRAGGEAQEAGVPAILGPRAISRTYPNFIDTDGQIHGVAAKYQEMGHKLIGFNTDAPVIPQEELFVQAAMGARFGLDCSNLEHLRGLTIVPATAAGISDRVGSIEPGKDADMIVVTGDFADPRSYVDMVFIEGQRVYDAAERRMW